jgi:poly-gamma-glutamate capsule biosynthesis protein CapA/YwtB (metallophosphatase superfamily)
MELLSGFIAGVAALFVGMFAPLHALGLVLSPPHEVHIVFGGDMLFDRTIRTTIEQKGGDYIFNCIDPVLSKADLVVANLEGPITDNPSVSQNSIPGDGNNYTFTQPTSTAPLLYKHNIRLVNIGNNHIMNFSRAGLLQTKEYLDAAGVKYFGDPDAVEADRVARIEVNGIPFSFVNWSDWTSDKTDHTVAQVRAEAESGRIVVVYTHWGVEYATTSLPRVQELAHEFVDAGASIVVGSHPHVVQQHEVYHGKNIYYSLGNLIFDQYWTDAVDHGLLLDVAFNKNGVKAVSELPIVLQHDRRTCLQAP